MSKKTKKKKKGTGEQHGSGRIFTGKLEVTRSGMGFVIVEGEEKDILVKRVISAMP